MHSDPKSATSEPIASFVIPVFNCECHIGRCLASIGRVRHRPVEVIVVDNGSTDRTREIVLAQGYDCLVLSGVHVSAVRNFGAARASADFIAFVDCDVELDPDWLEVGLGAFDDRRVVATGGFPGVPEMATWVQEAWDVHQRGRHPLVKPTPVAWLPSMSVIVRREDFVAIGGFNEELETAEDVDLCYRMGARGLIVSNPAMRSVHWGEAPDLRTFWRKEKWRSASNLRGVAVHGLRRDEIPSLVYPIYMLGAVVAVALAIVVGVWRGNWDFLAAMAVLAALPAVTLAANTARLARRPDLGLRLFVLYLVYGLARAYALLRG